MSRYIRLSLLAGLMCAASPLAVPALAQDTAVAAAVPPVIDVAVFAQRDAFTDEVISPDGKLMAYKTVLGGKPVVAVVDLATKAPIMRIDIPEDRDYEWMRWAGSGRVLVSVSWTDFILGDEVRVTRMVNADVTTKSLSLLGANEMGAEGDDLLWVAKDGTSALLSYQKSIYDWPSVMRFDLSDPKGKGKQVQPQVDGIWEWYADNAGVVRMGTGWVNNKMRVLYRKTEGERYREIARLDEDDDDKLFDIQRIVSETDEAYVLDEQDDGRVVLARYNLVTRTPVETIYRHEQWDLTRALLDRDGNPWAVDFTDDRDRRVWLDPAMAKAQRGLETALKTDEVWIGSLSADRSRALVYAGGEVDPGGLYVYDAAKKTLDPFAAYRPNLPIQYLARPKPMSYTARDGQKVAGYLTLPVGREPKGLPLIVLPHGGPYGVRDKLQYDDEVQVLANRGYAVLQVNYRGSGGYGGAYEKLGDGQIGRKMQDDLDDAMDWAVKEGIADRARVCMVGSSYGGYAAMWAVIRNPDRYRCAASFAGVTDWKRILKYDARFFSRKGAREWKNRVAGAEFDLDTVSPAHRVGTLDRPLLVAHGKKDSNVPFSQFKQFQSAANGAGKKVDYLVFEDEGHGFENAANEAKWFQALVDFLAKHNPPG